jgi:hypothetical protein
MASTNQESALWLSELEDRPTFMPLLLLATQPFRDPDATPSFHRYEQIVAQEATMKIRFACFNNVYSEMHISLVTLQILLMHMTGAEDLIVGTSRTVARQTEIVPRHLVGGKHKTVLELVEDTKRTLYSANGYCNVHVGSLLHALGVSEQSLLHQVSFDWIEDPHHSFQDMGLYSQQPQDLVLVAREEERGNLRVGASIQQGNIRVSARAYSGRILH